MSSIEDDLRDQVVKLTDQAKALGKQVEQEAVYSSMQFDRIKELEAESERLGIGHERYETVRRMSAQQFKDVFTLNVRTGKPFDQIIDELRPFRVALAQQKESK